MNWNLLGIQPTKDKKAITAAYRARLQNTNPEDKPEEFKALRGAYEEALRYAAQPDAPETRDESPVGRWMEQVQTVYHDYSARITPQRWRMLLSDPVCSGLDTRTAAEEALLGFLMEHYFLPQNVWQVLDEVLSLQSRREELCELCPREFVERVVLDGIRFPDSLPYDLFIPGQDADACDRYRTLYYQTNQARPEEGEQLLAQLEALPEQHPYGQALRCRQLLAAGDRPAALEGFRSLALRYPEDLTLPLIWAELCVEDGNTDEAFPIVDSILSRNPEHRAALRVKAECYAALERYDEAKDLLYDLFHAIAGDPVQSEPLSELMKQWNEKLIVRRERTLLDHPEDTENAIELAWCYIQNQRMDDAERLALEIDKTRADPYQYHNLLGKLWHNLQDFGKAEPHFRAVIELLRQLPTEVDAETEKKRRRLPEFLQLLGNSLLQSGEEKQAMVLFEEALSLAPDNPEVLLLMGRMLYSSGDYTRAAEILTRLIHIAPDTAHGNALQALTLYRLRRDRDAYDAVNRALAYLNTDLSAYVLKMQILLRNGVFEEVRAILDFLQESNAPESLSVDFARAQLTEYADKDEKKALAQYRTIARSMEQPGGDVLIFPALLYFRIAVLTGNEGKTSAEELLAILDKGLSEEPFDEDCLSYKAWLLSRSGRAAEAIHMYRSLLEKNNAAAENGLAELYSNHLTHYAQEALAFYEQLLAKRQTPELCFYTAACLRQMGDYEQSRSYYEKELELNPDDVDGYNGLAYLSEALGRNDEALQHVNHALEAMERNGQVYHWLIGHKIQILRRMNEPELALKAVEEARTRFNYPDAYQHQFDICCQFALWERAKQVIGAWKLAQPGDPYAIKAEGRYHLLRGEMFKCALAMGKIKHKLPFGEIEDFRLQLQDLECSHNKMLLIRARRAKEDPDNDYVLMNLAESLWRTGKREQAVATAQKALALLDETLKLHLTDEALYRSRRCLLLAMAGRETEAFEELKRVRNLPLCEFCEYGRCKDADIFEAQIEELLGRRDRAKALYEAGHRQWPDEPDFASGLARMKKKGK